MTSSASDVRKSKKQTRKAQEENEFGSGSADEDEISHDMTAGSPQTSNLVPGGKPIRHLKSQYRHAFDRNIFDEAHFLKNGHSTAQFRSAQWTNAPKHWLVSAPPMMTGLPCFQGLLQTHWSKQAFEGQFLEQLSAREKQAYDSFDFNAYDDEWDDSILSACREDREQWAKLIQETPGSDIPRLTKKIVLLLMDIQLRRDMNSQVRRRDGTKCDPIGDYLQVPGRRCDAPFDE